MTGLEAGAALLVLVAALLHASWNAFVKLTGERLLALAAITGTGAVLALCALPWVPPPEPESWPYLAASVVLHGFYQMFLFFAYRFGDLSHAYPIARGIAPLLVALLSAGLAGEVPSAPQAAGLAFVSLGIGSLAFAHGWPTGAGARGVQYALLTGVMISGYTVMDGQGSRLAGSAYSYIVWQFLLNGLPVPIAALVLRRRRIPDFLRASGWSAALGGLMSTLAYAIVIWAMSRGAMAHVSSLRETSVIFAAIIGTRMLGEPFGARRVIAAAVVAGGMIALSLSG